MFTHFSIQGQEGNGDGKIVLDYEYGEVPMSSVRTLQLLQWQQSQACPPIGIRWGAFKSLRPRLRPRDANVITLGKGLDIWIFKKLPGDSSAHIMSILVQLEDL